MLSARIKISKIGYEETFRQIFPIVKEKVNDMENENLLIQLFKKLDDAALPVLLGILFRLPEKTKNELLVLCLNAYAPKLNEKLNEQLINDEWGKYFEVGSLSITQEMDGLFLQIGQIKADYRALLDTEPVTQKLDGFLGSFARTGAKMAVTIAPAALEKKGLALIWKEENKKKLMVIAKKTLDKYGIFVDLMDIDLAQETVKTVNLIEEDHRDGHLKLTKELEHDVLDALAGYLKEQVQQL